MGSGRWSRRGWSGKRELKGGDISAESEIDRDPAASGLREGLWCRENETQMGVVDSEREMGTKGEWGLRQRDEGRDGKIGREGSIHFGREVSVLSTHSPLQLEEEEGWVCGGWGAGGTRTKPGGSSLGPAAPSQLTDPELITINEQLGPVSRDLHSLC